MRNLFTLILMAVMRKKRNKKQEITSVGLDAEKVELLVLLLRL